MPGSERSRSGRLSGGFTLIELLVAVSLLALLGTLLIMTFNDSLSLWSAGETQRKQYEEAHFLLRQISSDLRQLWIPVDERSLAGNSSGSMEPYLLSGFHSPDDAPFRGRWVDLVRSKPGYITGGESLDASSRFQRRVYVLLPGEGLFQATAPADRSFGHHNNPGRLNDPDYIREQFEPVASNVLYIDFRFWGPWMEIGEEFTLTDRWPAENVWGNGNNVSLLWDSSRRMSEKFRMYDGSPELPAIPAMVRVRVELTRADRSSWPKLAAPVSSDAEPGARIRVERGANLPSSGYVHIGDEWIRVDDENGRFTIRERGARGTESSRHETGDRVIAGKGFETTVYIPVYPGRSYYINRLKDSDSPSR